MYLWQKLCVHVSIFVYMCASGEEVAELVSVVLEQCFIIYELKQLCLKALVWNNEMRLTKAVRKQPEGSIHC